MLVGILLSVVKGGGSFKTGVKSKRISNIRQTPYYLQTHRQLQHSSSPVMAVICIFIGRNYRTAAHKLAQYKSSLLAFIKLCIWDKEFQVSASNYDIKQAIVQ